MITSVRIGAQMQKIGEHPIFPGVFSKKEFSGYAIQLREWRITG
jgi:hypothetical protein